MNDSAERRGPDDAEEEEGVAYTHDTEPDIAPLHSYVNELRSRVDGLPDDAEIEMALTVPPDATVRPSAPADIASALYAAAETVPRNSSSPEVAAFAPSVVVPPAAELPLRHIRRPGRELSDDFPVELAQNAEPPLRTRDRGRKSGRFVTPAGLRASLEQEGSIAGALKRLVDAERQETSLTLERAEANAEGPRTPSLPEAHTRTALPEQNPVVDGTCEHGDADGVPLSHALRLLALFTSASVAGGTAVYFWLHG